MARFLSPAWFARLAELAGPASPVGEPFVVEQVVERAPEGVVRYHVVIGETRARVVEGPAPRPEPPESGEGGPDVVLTSDYATASAIAQGELSPETALFEGRIRVRGDMDRLSRRAPELAGIDGVPPRLRDETSY